MHPRQRTAHRSPRAFDGGDVERNTSRALLDDGALLGRQGCQCRGREGEDAAFLALQFDGVAGKVLDLAVAQRLHVAAGAFEAGDDLGLAGGVGDHVEADQHEIGGDAHQDIGVVDRGALAVAGVEGHRLEVEMGAEALEGDRVGAVGANGIGDAVDMVEHHGAGAFQEQAVGLQPRIVDDLLHAVIGLQHLDDVGPALAPPARRLHRIEGDMAAGMGGEPVVGKHRIRGYPAFVLEEVHGDPMGRQGLGRPGDLGMSERGEIFAACARDLEVIVGGRLGVDGEMVRANHHHGGGGLDGEGGALGHGGSGGYRVGSGGAVG